ncbi:hypothetical protein JCM33374_g4687 [Metschnikowia sp. JCM 33374]|nr:hypothetical protein JCM33374_g4687 [Metschnikowia sp. JCM 33374]
MEIDDILADFEKDTRGSTLQSSAGLREQLVTAMLNERMAPDLLPYKHTLMARILKGIQDQQQFLLDSYEYGDSNAEAGIISQDFKLQLMIVETDIERLSYLVRLYIRTRLAKIDEFNMYYLSRTANETDHESLLSQPEKNYMQGHFTILTQLYNDSFLKKFPKFLTILDDTTGGENMINTPDLDQPVFIRVICEETISLRLGDDELELVKDGIYVVRYRLIMKYVEFGDVVLI